jgi:branched-chain amino acid transport system permease protein
MSLDIALYAGIVDAQPERPSSGSAPMAGIFAIHVSNDPCRPPGRDRALGGGRLVTGAVILHTQGVTLLMLTLAIVTLLYEAVNRASHLTGGDDGLQGITIAPLFGMFRFDLFGKTAYLYSLGVLFIWFLIAWRVVHSPFGRSLDGIRQKPARMRAIGTPVWKRLVAAYTLSAAMAGSAGALSAQTTKFVGLDTLGIFLSGIVAVMLVLRRQASTAFARWFLVVQDYAR